MASIKSIVAWKKRNEIFAVEFILSKKGLKNYRQLCDKIALISSIKNSKLKFYIMYYIKWKDFKSYL